MRKTLSDEVHVLKAAVASLQFQPTPKKASAVETGNEDRDKDKRPWNTLLVAWDHHDDVGEGMEQN